MIAKQAYIYALITKERVRQDALKAAGKFPYTNADPEPSLGHKALIVGEEFGEVCGAAMQAGGHAYDREDSNLRKELIELAAVTVAWLESMDLE